LQDDLIEAFGAEEVQAKLCRLAKQARGGNGKQAAADKAALLLEIEKPIVAKFGFEASAKGVQEAMLTYGTDEMAANALIFRRNNHMETLLAAGEPLDMYWTVFQMMGVRNEGHLRPTPLMRFPLIEIQEDKIAGDCVVERVPRTGVFSKEDSDALAAACKRGDVTKASQVMGISRVGATAKELVVNLGYRNLGPALGRTLGKALGKDVRHLELDASGNNLGLEGIKALAAGLSEGLQVLKLNVASNRINLEGVNALVSALPRDLKVLHLGFAGMKMGAEGAQALANGLPPGLRDLSLDLAGNRVTDAGVVAISEALPKTIESFTVVLTDNTISRRGLFVFDRQIGDPLNPHHLPLLTNDNFQKVAELEVYEFNEEADGSITRQLDHRSCF